jgi:hypothetical protein
LFYDAKSRDSMSKLFESYLAGQLHHLLELAPMFWPTVNSYKRLVDGFWAPVKPTWGIDNRTASFRVIRRLAEIHAARNALSRRGRQPVSCRRRMPCRRIVGRRAKAEAHDEADPRDQCRRRKHSPRAAHADRDHARVQAIGTSPATGSATISSTTSPPRVNGNGGSGWTP